MRIAMVNHQCWSYGTVVALLFLVAPLFLLGTVAGERNSTTVTEPAGSDLDVPGMITLNGTLDNFDRPRERRLATATVWCVSIANVSDTTLQSSLDWVCGPLANQGQVNCGPINTGGSCYDPNTLAHHCDWAFNTYFQKMNGTSDSCDFGGTAQEVTTDPSQGTCVFQGTNVTSNGTTGSPGAGPPANSPLSPAGSPIYSPSAATAAWQPQYLFRLSTGVILMTYLFT